MAISRQAPFNQFLLTWLSYLYVLREYHEASVDPNYGFASIRIPTSNASNRQVSYPDLPTAASTGSLCR